MPRRSGFGEGAYVRDTDAPIQTENIEQLPSSEYLARQMALFSEALGKIARQAENRASPVDEYNTVPLTGAASESILTVMPQYEYVPEKIESILVTGPAAASIIVTVGDRQWSLVIPASGLLPIGPVAILLGRNDPRQLTCATPGTFTMELMGVADARFNV